jgi:hypothetical protein
MLQDREAVKEECLAKDQANQQDNQAAVFVTDLV